MYRIITLLVVTCLLLLSCGDGSYEAKTYMENKSGHQVTIEPYRNKVLTETRRFVLAINEVQLVDANRGRGPSSGSTYGDLTGDSIVITFGDTLKVSHLGLNKTIPKSYPSAHPRNLKNWKSYTHEILENRKRYVKNEYRYIFTPANYQDALELNK